jgi:hypothetical protein
MPVSAEQAIGRLLDRALGDPGLAPKLAEHQIDRTDVQEALYEHDGELEAAAYSGQISWDAAREAAQEARRALQRYDSLPSWRRVWWAVRRQLSDEDSAIFSPVWPSTDRPVLARPGLVSAQNSADTAEQDAEVQFWNAIYVNWVRPQVTALINDYENPVFRSRLPDRPGAGLAEIYHPEYEVPTEAGARMSGLLTQMPGGSIGLCGFRGSGKSTLIGSLCQSSAAGADRKPVLGFMVSAPVRYDPREFVLYLFARLCQEILGLPSGRDPRPLTPDQVHDRARRPAWTALAAAGAAAVAVLTAGAIEITAANTGLSPGRLLGSFAGRLVIGIVLATAGYLALLVVITRLRVFRRGRLQHLTPSPERRRAADLGFDAELKDRARGWLDDIRYQLSYTSGWSGSLTVSGVQAGLSESTQTEERQRTLPNIIAGYRDLAIAAAQKSARLVIGIDELDKIGTDEEAEHFVNDIKSVFGIDGCYYLVSVSENAMSAFERRGLPFRDVFDSTFDEIVRIERFRYAQSRLLIRRRTIMPEPFIALCHCVSGGLPRDLIRAARSLYRLKAEYQLDGSLENLTRAFIAEDLRAKTAASWVALNRVTAEPQASLFKAWFRRITASLGAAAAAAAVRPADLPDGDDLYQSCAEFWAEVTGWPPASLAAGGAAGGDDGQVARLAAMALEITAYRYLAATIVQFFNPQLSDQMLRAAGAPKAGKASFEMLAEARLLFVNGPLLAWALISDFRQAHGLAVLASPDPCWLDRLGAAGPAARAPRAADGALGPAAG